MTVAFLEEYKAHARSKTWIKDLDPLISPSIGYISAEANYNSTRARTKPPVKVLFIEAERTKTQSSDNWLTNRPEVDGESMEKEKGEIKIHTVPVHSQCLNDQSLLSLQLKNSLTFNSAVSVKGVTCDKASHFTGLDLNRKSISSGINHLSILFSLQFLQNLNWVHNNFTFTQIPPGFSKLTRLTYLNLSNANVAGQIPIELLYMKNLVTLDLSTLYFSRGSQWCEAISSSLPYLQILRLSNCYLSGPIDSSLQNVQFLSDICLSQNNLSAPVLEIFADLPNLRSLHICFSSLYGKVPEKIFQGSTLEPLDLLENIFPQFPPNGSLHTLVLSNTTFSGTLPNSVGNLRVLSRIELSRCNFSGPIPNSNANLTQLLYLGLSYNNFTGTIPSFQMSKNITYIDLSHNALTGHVPFHSLSRPFKSSKY
ncbi:hypothetical protein HYC85_022170 [Camellia sinensis]|uniref:Uncharacterized protein n=1 Tax=Camellia sinensis TaxID=4442 RepID=A0A7J7GJM9_CAMSI|nr:hypothetical protein HYC85_022170 [Camellia sinensis]